MKALICRAAGFLLIFFSLAASACRSQTASPECDTVAPAPVAAPMARRPAPNADWCRACVMSPKGFASCQRVYAETTTEPREVVRQRSLDKACLDAGFGKGACPDQAIIAVGCKDDPPAPGTKNAGEALQQLFMGAKSAQGSTDSSPTPLKKEPKPQPATTDPPVI